MGSMSEGDVCLLLTTLGAELKLIDEDQKIQLLGTCYAFSVHMGIVATRSGWLDGQVWGALMSLRTKMKLSNPTGLQGQRADSMLCLVPGRWML